MSRRYLILNLKFQGQTFNYPLPLIYHNKYDKLIQEKENLILQMQSFKHQQEESQMKQNEEHEYLLNKLNFLEQLKVLFAQRDNTFLYLQEVKHNIQCCKSEAMNLQSLQQLTSQLHNSSIQLNQMKMQNQNTLNKQEKDLYQLHIQLDDSSVEQRKLKLRIDQLEKDLQMSLNNALDLQKRTSKPRNINKLNIELNYQRSSTKQKANQSFNSERSYKKLQNSSTKGVGSNKKNNSNYKRSNSQISFNQNKSRNNFGSRNNSVGQLSVNSSFNSSNRSFSQQSQKSKKQSSSKKKQPVITQRSNSKQKLKNNPNLPNQKQYPQKQTGQGCLLQIKGKNLEKRKTNESQKQLNKNRDIKDQIDEQESNYAAESEYSQQEMDQQLRSYNTYNKENIPLRLSEQNLGSFDSKTNHQSSYIQYRNDIKDNQRLESMNYTQRTFTDQESSFSLKHSNSVNLSTIQQESQIKSIDQRYNNLLDLLRSVKQNQN